MKKIFVMFAMSALALTSCLQEENPVSGNNGQNDAFEPSGELVEKVFTVGEIKSKTYIDGTVEEGTGDLVTKWCADDAISVWDGVANRKFTMEGEPDGASATFKGYVDAAATEFFAFYPYSEALAHKTASSQHVFSFPKSNIQYANPEGGLADGAAFACGKVENDVISFGSNSCMLKFSLAEGMEVKSVTIKGNEDDDVLAGTTNFTYNGTSFSPGFEQSSEKFNEITFCNEDGSNLKTGTDYYIAMQDNQYNAGYTVSLALADGTVYSRSSSKAIQYMSGSVYPLSAKPLSHGMFSYYYAYMAGEDIVIAGKAYNKETYGDAELISGNEDYTASGNKIYFISSDANCKLSMSEYIDSKVIIVGDNPSCRTQVVQDKPFKLKGENSHIAVMNLDIDMQITTTGAGNDVVVIDGNPVVDRIAFDNCKLEYPTNGRQFMYESQTTSVYKEFCFYNCDFVITVMGTHAYIVKVDSSTTPQGKFDFQNNVFWHTSTLGAGKGFNVFSGTSASIAELVFKNNTFVNVKTQSNASAYFHIIKVDSDNNKVNIPSVDIQNNLIYNEYIENSGGEFLIRSSADSGTCVNNVVWANNHSKGFHPFGNGTPSGMTKFTQLSESPFTSMDLNTGTFVKADAYKNYGAKR